jgi:Ser/Thr protein kinase RdoA (MazF antagonist)
MWKLEIVHEACRRFNGDIETLKKLEYPYKNTYEYKRNEHTFLLKLFPRATRDEGVLQTELAWIDFLHQHQINISPSISSINNQKVETIWKLPFPCCAVSFPKITGKKIDPSLTEDWNDQFFRDWGETMGKMHALSFDFLKSQPSAIFEQWNEGEIYYHDFTFVNENILKIWQSYLDQIASFPKKEDNYGLTHNNLTYRNFLIEENGRLILIDLSDCKYHFFTHDIAIALFEACMTVQPAERSLFKEIFLKSFLYGYQDVHTLQSDWRDQLDFFIEFRFIYSYLRQVSKQRKTELTPTEKEQLQHIEQKIIQRKPAFSN